MRREPGASGALANVALLERELGGLTYKLWRREQGDDVPDADDLTARSEALLARLHEEHARLAALRRQP